MTRFTNLSFAVVAATLTLSTMTLSSRSHANPDLKRQYILSVIKDAVPDVQSCGNGNEVVKTSFVIDENGKPKKVKVLGKQANGAVRACVTEPVEKLCFGPNRKTVSIPFPFRLGNERNPGTVREAKAETQPQSKHLSRKEVAELLKIIEPELNECGDGTVKSSFTIQPSGVVREVKVESEEGNEKAEKCVTRRLSRVRFPVAEVATPVTQSFQLN